MSTEERTSRLEGAYEQVADRLNDMSLDIRDLRSESRKQFYWTIWVDHHSTRRGRYRHPDACVSYAEFLHSTKQGQAFTPVPLCLSVRLQLDEEEQ